MLLKPATRWLAVELSKREMLANVPWYYLGNWCKRYQSQIHNFFGVINYASAPTHGSFFYQLAIEDLQAAVEFDPNWYQPYENLGDTYSTQGREFQENKRINLQRQAILQYEKALVRCEDETVRRRIKVGKAMAQLLTKESNSRRRSSNRNTAIRETVECRIRFKFPIFVQLSFVVCNFYRPK